ncbi:DUF397 domain-containing protein [Streptomyces anulatus]|uniref:DUF397 domain-containing protein n=1 Tax=Streptomyces anulatus TaxID=1892 RepID=UPI0035E242B4
MLGQHHGVEFRKSSHSDPDNCVFVARPPGATVAVKDGKTPQGPALEFGDPGWGAFIEWAARLA